MSRCESPVLHDCVALWLLELRRAVDMECTSILLAKPIPTRPSTSMANSLIALSGAQSELILGGRIPIGLSDSEVFGGSIEKRPTPKTKSTPRSLSISVPGSQILNDSFLKAVNHNHFDDDDDKFPSPPHYADSGLELICNASGSSSDEREPSNINSHDNHWNLKHMKNTKTALVDSCSLDSACGSSPVLSNDCEGTSSGNSNTPSGSPLTSRHDAHNFPLYSQLKESLTRLLNSASQMYSSLELLRNQTDDTVVRNVVQKVKSFFELADQAGFCAVLPFKDFVCMKSQVEDLYYGNSRTRIELTPQFTNLVRSLSEKVLGFFGKVILGHLAEATLQDVYMYSALKHLAHLSLFGEQVCLEVIQVGGVSVLYRLCRQLLSTSAPETLKQILRTLAVLCSVSKGCVQLLSVGGLDLVTRLLTQGTPEISVEAAGVLTQLTAPCHSFAILPTSLNQVVLRLLDMCESCSDCESLLLCCAALANLTLQHHSVSQQLYEHNAVLRLCAVISRQTQPTVFVMDQMATILARLSANGYDQALISQGAIPTLLKLLHVRNDRHAQLCNRIHHKAALCLGSLASQSFGLKAVHDNNGRECLQKAILWNEGEQNPVHMICHNLLDRITSRFELESAV